MAKRQTIGNNPLEALLDMTAKPLLPSKTALPEEPEHKAFKEKLTVNIDSDLLELMKNAVYWSPGMTLTSLAEDGIALAIEKMEKERGSKFPPRKGEIKKGKPFS